MSRLVFNLSALPAFLFAIVSKKINAFFTIPSFTDNLLKFLAANNNSSYFSPLTGETFW